MNKTLMSINTLNNTLTMSSLEIAELTGKEHFHVMRDIRGMLEQLGGERGESKSGGTLTTAILLDKQGKERPCYHLDKDHTICLISGYETSIRMRIIKRWQELESKQSTPSNKILLPDFSNPAEAARAWAAEYEAKQQLALENESLKIELDQTHDWSTIKRQEKIHGRRFNWYVLKSYCLEHKIEIREVFDQNYGSVKAYHRSAWYAVFNVII